MSVLVDLEQRSIQIEGLAAALSSALVARDIERATRKLQRIREEVGLTEISIAVLKAHGRAPAVGSSIATAAAPAPVVDERDDARLALEAKERVLTERLLAVLVQLRNLQRDARSMQAIAAADTRFGLKEITRFLHDQIGRLNASWLWGKRTDRAGALDHALRTLHTIGQHQGVLPFLEEASRSESEQTRKASVLLAALLELTIGARP